MENVVAGFLIVRSYNWLYSQYSNPARADQFVYGIPRMGIDPCTVEKRYRGISRDPLWSWHEEFRGAYGDAPEEIGAASALGFLDRRNLSNSDFIFTYADVLDVFAKLKDPASWEIIWAADADAEVEEPAGAKLLGFEPTYFDGDHFSAIADSLFFPTWHGTDEAGTLFLEHYLRLNEHGLFPTATLAKDFLDYYLSFDWTETGDFLIAKVMSI